MDHRPNSLARSGKGTDSAILQRATTAEAAKESGFNLNTLSWDFRKAFASVSKQIIKLAWCIPTDVVEWIAAPDQDSHLIHLTPHTEVNWHPNNDTPL
eukprot:gene8797-biopygen4208